MTLVNPTLLNSSFIPHLTFSKPLKPVAPILLQRRIIFPRYNATTANVNDSERKSANYQPNLWTYDFLQSLKHAYADIRYEDRAKMLKEEVRRMIKDESSDIWLKLELINDVKRLGLSYHYDKEIHEVLLRCHSSAGFSATFVNTSLHETALCFRLLREYGHDVSPDIFERFKEENGNFKENLVSDVKGMLSLYEASFLGYEGEKILDEAMVFCSFHLRVALNKGKSSNMLLEQVNHALELPLHHRIQRLEARWYIESYAKRTDSNQLLLEAAKLDFNIVQSTLQNDLQQMSRSVSVGKSVTLFPLIKSMHAAKVYILSLCFNSVRKKIDRYTTNKRKLVEKLLNESFNHYLEERDVCTKVGRKKYKTLSEFNFN